MNFKIYLIKDLNEKEKNNVDKFIMDENTNGEFINSIEYLSYHPEDRFIDDSILIKDEGSGTIKCVMMAASRKGDDNTIISHPGTTFSGPIINKKSGVEETKNILDMMVSYYDKYPQIELRSRPSLYSNQPMEIIDYFLLRYDFKYGMTGLANVIKLTNINSEEEQFTLCDSKRRNQVRKVIKEDKYSFIEKERIDSDIWKNMNRNLQNKFESNTTHSFEEIDKLHKKLPKHIVPYTTIRKDGNYGAFALVYKFKNVFHTQYLDVNYEYRNEYPNLLLIHKLIQVAKSEGYSYFSFGASTEDGGEFLNEGLYNYKNGFGGGDVLLPVYRKNL